MNSPERWQELFHDLPLEANVIAVDRDGWCRWYEVDPRQLTEEWLAMTGTKTGRVRRIKKPASWKTAIRVVWPSERVLYVKKSH